MGAGHSSAGSHADAEELRHTLTALHHLATITTTDVPGDVPSLIAGAFHRQFREEMPSLHDYNEAYEATTGATADELLARLSKLPPLKKKAQVLLDRVHSILTDGPALSMSIPLLPGHTLAGSLVTLRQGTIWGVLMACGADPDLGGRLMERRGNQYKPHDKLPWFLCKKFYHSHLVAEKDGETLQQREFGCPKDQLYVHIMYAGRLFKVDPVTPGGFSRAAMPHVTAVHSCDNSHVAVTPRGVFVWGHNDSAQLGRTRAGKYLAAPTRLTFPCCPEVAAYEQGLPPWHRHTVVEHVWMGRYKTFISTPVGLVMAGLDADAFCGIEKAKDFAPVPVPSGFVPDHAMVGWSVILTMGDRQMIGGSNQFGQLGLGHTDPLQTFVEQPFVVEEMLNDDGMFTVFVTSSELLFAGQVTEAFARSNLLPGYTAGDVISSATPLQLPATTTAFLGSLTMAAWVTEGKTHVATPDTAYALPFPVSHCGMSDTTSDDFYCTGGEWCRYTVVDEAEGVASLTVCDPPDFIQPFPPVTLE
ncbi:hypothetical protein J8273_0406 [Carpediemonas membranifera]|uniref:Uncharacterized protein n=1 Tax=Carpediemonas membranifera TaxID=201153 RepID=A0A8J6E359_9EUKA|nr:hypothetical protein J8273_0406 [Carpediemonas membranifera]|eukprot:KAG9395186.1 hypothetical protein J8273_0406 [Carpediemonas membranifera]